MRKEGELLICTRCGKTDFIEKADKRKPAGWDGYQWTPPGWKTDYGRDLCPGCAELYDHLVDEFMRSGKVKVVEKA